MAAGAGVFSEYLVKLGFTEDMVSYARFASVLRGTTSLVDNEFFKMGKKVLEFQTAAVGVFAAIGAAAIGIADKTAMADQEYRLLALHMYTSLPVARELKIALDALGQPLENIMWDPELARRFNQLVKDQRALTEELGPNFESQMIKIRDVRFEFTRLGVEVQYLTMLLVEDLAEAFGTDIDSLLNKLRSLNEYLINNLPEIAAFLSENLKPVLEDVGVVMESLWDFTKQFVVEYTNLIALISGDDSLETSTADFHKLAAAIRMTVDGIALATVAIFQLGKNLLLLLDAGVRAVSGDTKGAMKDLAGMKPLTEGFEGRIDQEARKQIANTTSVAASPVKTAIAMTAAQLGVPISLALATAQDESNFKQFDKSGKVLTSKTPGSHAMGIFQLQPGTAREMGVDPTTEAGNIAGGVLYLKKLLDTYGDSRVALEHYYGSKDAAANEAYANKVLHIQAGIQIGTLTVNVPDGASGDKTKTAVIDAIREADRQRTQRTLSEFQAPGWSY